MWQLYKGALKTEWQEAPTDSAYELPNSTKITSQKHLNHYFQLLSYHSKIQISPKNLKMKNNNKLPSPRAQTKQLKIHQIQKKSKTTQIPSTFKNQKEYAN